MSTRQDVAKRHPLSRDLENTLLAFTHPYIHNCKHIIFFGGGSVWIASHNKDYSILNNRTEDIELLFKIRSSNCNLL